LVIGYRTRLTACQRLFSGGCAVAATILSVALPGRASAQRAGGEIGVSLTILPPSATQTAALAGRPSSTERSGVVLTRATRSTAKPNAPLVVTRLSSEKGGSVPAGDAPALPPATSRPGCATLDIEQCVDVGRLDPEDHPHVVRLRVAYFVVAGT
jgi:hypothetical protein